MAFQFYVEIEGLDNPKVWRRLIVPDDTDFMTFSDVLQVAFGWSGEHGFLFAPNGYGTSPSIGVDGDEDKDAEGLLLKEVFKKLKQKMVYIYDFGDDWFHIILLEKMLPGKNDQVELIDGGGCCPPEDIGGVFGYEDMLSILNDASSPQYEDMREFLGLEGDNTWDPNYFDAEDCREGLSEFEF